MLKVNDRAIVRDIDRNNVHPAGVAVKVMIVDESDDDPRPYYCIAEDGRTSYWYAESELDKI